MLDRDRIGGGVEIWQRLIFRHPGAVDEKAPDRLALLVEQIDAHLLAQIGEEVLGEPWSSTCAALAQLAKSISSVTPRSSAIASYLVRPDP